ncbi:oligogalacturonate lyase [Sphingomonas sp. Leaf339]|uniref:oligogalacturonate lyase family protein n=1 Tax=Sphingomonas sp. Leaf339 TaxID=1736343 RepID=UPI0006F849B8|nr:oligogalacturonate lyase family protein [Sphingomonas sp. Leaf339]KQU62071.1 oligogalacturonate lyase [Sphingomonas sp. Leaf339]
MKFASLLLAMALPAAALAQAPSPPASMPASWVDAKTGHRVMRLSDVPGNYLLYFNYNAFTPQGDKMVFSTAEGISVVDLKTWAVKPLVKQKIVRLLFTGHNTRTAYYTVRATGKAATAGAGSDGQRDPLELWAADIDSGKARKVIDLPAGQIDTMNADETLVAGQVAERAMPLQPGRTARSGKTDQAEYAANGPDGKPLPFAEAKEVRLNDRLEARIPMEIFTIDLKTGARTVVHQATDWLNHLQFSPTDSGLLMFCHEGPWHKVDRIWTIRTDGTQLTKIHTRTMNMEIAGHEWWSPDGKTIWYDLQTPRGQVFWVAGYDVATQKRRWYHVERNQWSVHYNTSSDGKTFAGDGGDSEMVAHAPDGKWIYLLTPQAIPDVAGIHAADADSLIAPGTFAPERLVDLSKHNYQLEPNIHFTPDNKWILFRSNMEGRNAIYAVEVAKAVAR